VGDEESRKKEKEEAAKIVNMVDIEELRQGIR